MSGFLENVISKMLKSVSKHKAQQMCNMSEKSRKNKKHNKNFSKQKLS